MRFGINIINTIITGIMVTVITVVNAGAVVVPAEDVRTAIVYSIKMLAEDSGLDVEVNVLRIRDIDVKGMDDPVMKINVSSEGKVKSRIPVRVEFSDSTGKVCRRFQFTARVNIFKDVVVITSDKKRGEAITDDDIEITHIDVSELKDYYEDISILDGVQADRIIRAGTVLGSRHIKTSPVISRGERVRIMAQVGAVTVTAEGTARQDGGKGDAIRVYNDMTRTTLKCRVLGAKTVTIGL